MFACNFSYRKDRLTERFMKQRGKTEGQSTESIFSAFVINRIKKSNVKSFDPLEVQDVPSLFISFSLFFSGALSIAKN